ncbi:MAG: ribonuclease P protein subunit [Candidatus Micrarchaeia archaeon]
MAEELIGLSAKVLDSACKGLIGLEGKVVDETKDIFVIRTAKGDKLVPKKGSVFQFEGHPEAPIKGDWVCFRPEDRTKKVSDLLRRNRLR